jgi:hypothetical protein
LADETKLTFKMGIIATLVAGIVVFIMNCLWSHQTDITILKTNYIHTSSTLQDIKLVVDRIEDNQVLHDGGLKKINKASKRNIEIAE